MKELWDLRKANDHMEWRRRRIKRLRDRRRLLGLLAWGGAAR